MTTKVVMEALSPTMEEGRLVEWKKQEGDTVAVGDVLAEVETDKAVMELVARAAGTLLKHIVEAGATVPVSEPVAVIGQPGEDGGAAAAPAPAATEERPAPEKAAARAGNGAKASAPPASSAPGRVKASPLARRIAAERGVDLVGVAGSGPEGRVVARDLESATAAPSETAPSLGGSGQAPQPRGPALPSRGPAIPTSRPAAASRGPTAGAQPYTDTPVSQIRKTIARRLTESIGPVPTFYLTTEVDMERVWDAREALPEKVSFNDIIIKAVALALRQHPACNAWWQDDHIRYWNEVHVSMAVAIEEGLITPVIRHADQKSLREISAESRDLAGRARERRLKPEEYSGGTFSVSNLGMLDIDEFTAIINPPEAGILAVGRIAEKAVAHDGAVALRRQMRLTMSCDHRVIDGATGAQFLKTLKGMMENPLALVW
jgi:pyruvate dehydrogenase E2 component (dihydrolipoyllysine-residue acetyltransferase)